MGSFWSPLDNKVRKGLFTDEMSLHPKRYHCLVLPGNSHTHELAKFWLLLHFCTAVTILLSLDNCPRLSDLLMQLHHSALLLFKIAIATKAEDATFTGARE